MTSKSPSIFPPVRAPSLSGNNVTFATPIGNASTGNFSKTNTPGTLTLTSTATYTGTTAISGGTLALGANNIIPDSSNVSIGAATLDAATFDDQLGTLDVTAAATINLGTGANLIFADSNLVDWTGGTLNITGTFVSGSSIKFATTGGLTSTQLALITQLNSPNTAKTKKVSTSPSEQILLLTWLTKPEPQGTQTQYLSPN